ncbi:helix-turn-helix domain-containing protein [Amycolatopsis sp. NPDC026612]|uniref:ATP-binding protein n=1 Tax=Amycolatopsis sp. NPDC026612 TaxID=3155466 RepID=UPI003405A22A
MIGPSLGRLLREHRSGVGWTIEELAHRAGVSPRTVSDLERDRVRRPQRRTLTAVLDALGLAAADRDLVRRTAGVDRSPPGPCPMPAPPPHFTGRRDARDAIRALAGADTAGPAPVAVVTGQPGVGKTALALHVAHELADMYPDGRFFVDLRGTQPFPATPAEALRRLLLALGVAEGRIPAGLDERARVYRGLLRHRRVLLVLDNAATEDQVRPLLPGDGPGLLLLTCRRWLSGLEAVRWLPLEPLPPDDAAALLHAVGRPHTGDAPEPIAVLAAHCGHLPLALRVAGQRLHDEPDLTVPALNGRLARARDRIAVLDGGAPGVAAALRLSYQSLPLPGRRTLRRLAVIPGPDFTADAAAALCGVDPADAEDELDALVECGLLTIRPPDRYSLHDLVRDFAATCLRGDEPDGGRAASDTLVRWLLETTVRAGRHFEPGGPGPGPGAVSPAFTDAAPARAWLDANLDNWLPALRTAAETGADDLVVAVADALHWFSDHRLHLGIWAEVFRLGAEAAVRTGDVAVQAVHLNHLAWAQAICEGDHLACLGTAGEALRCAEAAGDVAQQGWALMCAASARTALGEHGAALRLRQRAWVALRKAGDREGVPQAMRLLGSSLTALGRAGEALRVHRATLRLLRDPGYPMAPFAKAVSDALTCGAIGIDLAAAGRWPEGVDAFREALAGVRAGELRTQEPGVLIGLADALRHTGAVAEAAGHLAAAVELARDLGDAETAARAVAMVAGLAPPAAPD